MGVIIPRVLLVGNPNCGKTTLFNSLTKDNQRVGNWAGVTVEKKTGLAHYLSREIQITDLPGLYSLSVGKDYAEDSRITASNVANNNYDLIVNVIDACNLERNLYLTTQLLELNIPVIIVLNMMDVARSRKINIDINLLKSSLNCPVISSEAHKDIGVDALKQSILDVCDNNQSARINQFVTYPSHIQQIISDLKAQLNNANNEIRTFATYHANRILEGGDVLNGEYVYNCDIKDIDIEMADARYTQIHNLVIKVQTKASDLRENITSKIDNVVLNRFFALPIFLSVMYLVFLLAINVGSAFTDFFDIVTQAIFVNTPALILTKLSAPNWLIALIANGVGKGINTAASFIPVIAIMFFLLSILETTGYMSRAAFVIDRLMRALGLPGKSFIPMIVGFGCNVPGIMAARTLDTERDRILTVLMSPFMSCSARLAIYAVFVSAFFPQGGQNVVFSLYVIGILMAVFTGFILRKTVLHGKTSPLIIELPAYHRPGLKRLLKDTSHRLKYFITRACKIIIPVCVVLNGLDSYFINTEEYGSLSIIALFGKWLTPLFSPIGIEKDNWPAVVGLLTGTLAKEVVIGSLNSLYAKVGHINQVAEVMDFNILQQIHMAFKMLMDNLVDLGRSLVNPLLTTSKVSSVNQSIYGVMYKQFGSGAAAYAYLLFVLLYVPCVSTMAAIRQETSAKYMWFSIIWSLLIAYSVSALYYQSARILDGYKDLSLLICVILVLSVGALYLVMRVLKRKKLHAFAVT